MNEQTSVNKTTTVRGYLDLTATILMIAASSFIILALISSNRQTIQRPPSRPSVPVPSQPISLDGAHLKGSAAASIVLVEYSEFECPYCARFARDVFPELVTRYIDPGRVQLAFKHLPLANHRWAIPAAHAAECAGQQRQFWQMHDALFGNQRNLSDSLLANLGAELGLDQNAFQHCLTAATPASIEAHAAEARAFRISGTPTFIVGDRLANGTVRATAVISGARPFADFAKAFDERRR